MTCIRTGADIYLVDRQCIVHGDLFEVGDVYILECNGHWRDCVIEKHDESKASLRVGKYEHCGNRTIVMEKDHCGDFSYEGWPVKM